MIPAVIFRFRLHFEIPFAAFIRYSLCDVVRHEYHGS